MSEFNTTEYVNEASGLKSYITGVFVKMGLALTITALVAFGGYFCLAHYAENAVFNAIANVLVYGMLVAIIAQLVVCVVLSRKITTMQTSTATALFYG